MRVASLLIALVSTCSAWSQRQPVGESRGSHQPTKQRDQTPPNHITHPKKPTPSASGSQNLQNDNKNYAQNPTDKTPEGDQKQGGIGDTTVAISTAIIALFTVVQVVVLTQQRTVMAKQKESMVRQEDLLKQSLDATKDAIAQSERSTAEDRLLTKQVADAATRSAKTGEDALKVVERAFLRVSNTSIVGSPQISEALKVKVDYENVGMTFATVKRRMCSAHVDIVPMATPIKYAAVIEDGHALFPKDSLYMNTEFAMTQVQVAEVLSGSKNLYLHAIFEYEDAFGQDHTTRMDRVWNIQNSQFLYVSGPDYNYAD